MDSTVSRICSTACDASSRPNTDKTPRIWASWRGTAANKILFWGSRKYRSKELSNSPREVRSSPTTLPMVCLSLTRRYRSSIQLCSGWGMPPTRTSSRRSARLAMRTVIWGSLGSRSSNAASRYSTDVATSIASSTRGVTPALSAVSTARVSATASGSLGG